jgi:uncharacterized protein (DUF1800 family)
MHTPHRIMQVVCVCWAGALSALPSPLAQAAPMGETEARTLLFRTSFAANTADIRTFAQLDRQQAVDRILNSVQTTPQSTPADMGDREQQPSPADFKQLSEEDKKRALKRMREQSLELRAWWYGEMLGTPSPFTEKMTLFWHNHFTSGVQKVKFPMLMYRQNLLLRREALGNFGVLLHDIAKDPAMILYLDNVSNHKGKPNENFAREVMELFTLGEGHYSEQDIRDAARAFTGWGLDRETGTFRFYRAQHDEGSKTVLGKTGNLNGDDVLDILLARPETAEFIVNKLWRTFISPEAEPAEVKKLAALFRDRHYELKPLMRALLTEDALYSPENRAALTKSPAELIVGTLRQFNLNPHDTRPLAFAAQQMGQDIFNPPNVKGWPGGERWINSNTLLLRKQALERLLRGIDSGQKEDFTMMSADRTMASAELRPDPQRWMAQFLGDPHQQAVQATHLLLAAEPVSPIPDQATPVELLHALLLDPVYQLN